MTSKNLYPPNEIPGYDPGHAHSRTAATPTTNHRALRFPGSQEAVARPSTNTQHATVYMYTRL